MAKKMFSQKQIIYTLSILFIIYLGYLALKSKTFEGLVAGVDYGCADATKCLTGICFNAGFAGKGGFCAPTGFSWDKFRAASGYKNDDSAIGSVGIIETGWPSALTKKAIVKVGNCVAGSPWQCSGG